MNAVFELCRAYGVSVRFAELGDWGRDELRAEYDPAGPEIRIHIRLQADLVARAIGHELYHHREAIGEVAVLRNKRAREAAADAFAAQLLEARA
jgi:hypothetical protein